MHLNMMVEQKNYGDLIYNLNKKKVIRSKILDLMEIANAGLNQINNVQQGTVTRISEMTSEEKRIVIEDLIGLSAFDENKKEAEKHYPVGIKNKAKTTTLNNVGPKPSVEDTLNNDEKLLKNRIS